MKQYFALFLILYGLAGAQASLPILLGANLEMGNGAMPPQHEPQIGLVRINPYVGVWLPSYAYGKLILGQWSTTENSESGQYQVRERILGGQVGISFFARTPYLLASLAKAYYLTTTGDVEWWEWGVGVGMPVPVSEYISLLAEIEYKTINEHFNPLALSDYSGSRLSFSLGVQAFVF